MKHLKSFGDALRRSFIICPLNASSLPSQLFSHIAIKSASCRNSTEVVWGAHNVQPTQMTVLGKKNPRAALSCSLPLCLQPSSTVPHAPWGSSTGRRHGTCPRTQRSPGTEPPEVSRSSTRQHVACHSPAIPTAFWGPGPWQGLPVGLAPLNQHISNFNFGQVIWDWKFPFTPELEI